VVAGRAYLAYSLTDKDTQLSRLYVYDLGSGKAVELGREYADAMAPAFSPDGKYLYFLGDREWSPQFSSVELDYATNRTTQILAYALRKDVKNPFAPRNDSSTGDDNAPDSSAPANKGDDEHGKPAKPKLALTLAVPSGKSKLCVRASMYDNTMQSE